MTVCHSVPSDAEGSVVLEGQHIVHMKLLLRGTRGDTPMMLLHRRRQKKKKQNT